MHSQSTSRETYWVFGYGSLIWRPGFEYVSAQRALLPGAHRQLCVYSYRYRGTKQAPGLVFGLIKGGSCRGMAFQVDAAHWDEVLAYLRDRELVNKIYHEVTRPVRLADGQRVEALTFLTDITHSQYAGDLDLKDQLRHVRQASGEMGPNRDYVVNTFEHLREMGMVDRRLEEINILLAEDQDPNQK